MPFKLCRCLLFIGVLLLVTGCITTTSDAEVTKSRSEDNDPLEPLNRVVYAFNEKLDIYLIKPLAEGYRAVTPDPMRRGVSNFFSNLEEPMTFLNDALQGKFKAAASDLGRLLMNTTFGMLGLFDVATGAGLKKNSEDLGQTLGAWGVGDGPYLVLPLLGPRNVRDGVGRIGDYMSDPLTYLNDVGTRDKLRAAEVVDLRTSLLDSGDILQQAAGQDPYVFRREAYRQFRLDQIYDGAPPSLIDLSDLFEDDPAPRNTPDKGPETDLDAPVPAY